MNLIKSILSFIIALGKNKAGRPLQPGFSALWKSGENFVPDRKKHQNLLPIGQGCSVNIETKQSLVFIIVKSTKADDAFSKCLETSH